MLMKKRYAICGLSLRGIHHFVLPLMGKSTVEEANDFSATAEVVGILDSDEARTREFLDTVGVSLPFYSPERFQAMINEQNPEVILVAGPDYTHGEYIIKALEAGCEVIVEKPMVISAEQAREVIEAEKRTGMRVHVAFNYRYTPAHCELKKLIRAGRIGRITNVELVWNLDTHHGASYFFRWNRERDKSGGLNIHKCCHHFDLVNWWLDDIPETVFAFGALNYYGPKGAHRPRDENGNPFDSTATKERCPYFQRYYADKLAPQDRLINPGWDPMKLGYPQQYPKTQDRYIYDEDIDIEDTYSVVMRYRGGASLSYSCNFSTPWEGYILGINGTEGRVEMKAYSNPDPTGSVPSEKRSTFLTYLPLFGGKEEIVIPPAPGGHGGSDRLIQRDLFIGLSEESRELSLTAGSHAGAVAVAQGEAVWESIRTGLAVEIPAFQRLPVAEAVLA